MKSNVDQRVEENSEQSSIKLNFEHILSELKNEIECGSESRGELWVIINQIQFWTYIEWLENEIECGSESRGEL